MQCGWFRAGSNGRRAIARFGWRFVSCFMRGILGIGILLSLAVGLVAAQDNVALAEKVLGESKLRLTVRQAGAIIAGLEIAGGAGNWLAAPVGPGASPYGHFLCYDRWGPPTPAEAKRGILMHGEAARTPWQWLPGPADEAALAVTLPKSRLTAARALRLAPGGNVFSITNTLGNPTKAPRVYNLVEHVTLAERVSSAPLRVATNATRGLLQYGGMLLPEPDFTWPHATFGGRTWDLRENLDYEGRMLMAMTFPAEAEWGWICVQSLDAGEVLGYVWRTADYPWLLMYYNRENGRMLNLAIEPGTTGLHANIDRQQQVGTLLGRSLYRQLKPGEKRTSRLHGFAFRLPNGAGEVKSVTYEAGVICVSFVAGQDVVLSADSD